jgi:uncharacterized iron-regulated membrane protein
VKGWLIVHNVACLATCAFLVVNGHPWFGLLVLAFVHVNTTSDDKQA